MGICAVDFCVGARGDREVEREKEGRSDCTIARFSYMCDDALRRYPLDMIAFSDLV